MEKPVLRTVTDNISKRLAILRHGSIERRVARITKALGINIIVFTANQHNITENRVDKNSLFRAQGTQRAISQKHGIIER